jgi:uncharacterized membrane protein
MPTKSYADLIIAVLEKYGGSAPQALIVKEARIPQPAVSKALKALEEKGLVARERLGRVKVVRLLSGSQHRTQD